jgi:hypothetical protein
MRTLKLHFPDEALPTLDIYLKQTNNWLRVLQILLTSYNS